MTIESLGLAVYGAVFLCAYGLLWVCWFRGSRVRRNPFKEKG